MVIIFPQEMFKYSQSHLI